MMTVEEVKQEGLKAIKFKFKHPNELTGSDVSDLCDALETLTMI